MFVIEDVFAIVLLIAVSVWTMLSSWRWVRILIASLYLFVLVDGVMSYEPAARSAVSRHKPWTQEFKNGVSTMLSHVSVFRPYILVAGAGLFVLAIKSQRTRKQLLLPNSDASKP
jgi:hypothetical protein